MTQNALPFLDGTPSPVPSPEPCPPPPSPLPAPDLTLPEGLSLFDGVTAALTQSQVDGRMLLRTSADRSPNSGNPAEQPSPQSQPLVLADHWLVSNGWRRNSGSLSHTGRESRTYDPPWATPKTKTTGTGTGPARGHNSQPDDSRGKPQ